MKSVKLVFTTIGLLLLSKVVSDQIIYRFVLVPQLDKWTSVPFVWWIVVYAPILIAMFYVSSRISSLLDVLEVSLASAIVHQLYEFAAANLGHLGHFKSFAIEDPAYFWTVASTLIFLVHVAWYGLLWFGFQLLRKKRIISDRSSAEAR